MAIINPVAGTGKGRKIGRIISSSKENIDILFTSPEKTALELAREAVRNGYERVLAVGGDGTVSQIAGGLLKSGVSLGIIPAGTGNDFAKGLGIPHDPENALKTALFGRMMTVDLGKIGNRVFVNSVSFGFDASLTKHIPVLREKRFLFGGKWLYLIAFSREFFSSLGYPKMTMCFPGEGLPKTVKGRITVLVASNGPQYGGMFKIAPRASFTDGLLDVCWIDKMSRARILVNLYRVFLGKHENLPQVLAFKTPSLFIHSEGKLDCQADGEFFELSEESRTISVIHLALNVMVPFSELLPHEEWARSQAPGFQLA